MRGKNLLLSSADNFSIRFKMNIQDNRRKVNQALTQIMSSDSRPTETFVNKLLNSSMVTESQQPAMVRPKVLSLTSQQLKMGDLTCANTKFELKAAPRVNRIQAALFTDKRQQINSPMFRKGMMGQSIFESNH